MIDQYNDEVVKWTTYDVNYENASMEGFIVSKYNHLQEQFLNDMKG